MYKAIKEWLYDRMKASGIRLDLYDNVIFSDETNVQTEDIAYKTTLNRPCIAFPYMFRIRLQYSIENNRNKDTNFLDAIHAFLISDEIGKATARGIAQTIDSEDVYVKLISFSNFWQDNLYQAEIKIECTYIKIY